MACPAIWGRQLGSAALLAGVHALRMPVVHPSMSRCRLALLRPGPAALLKRAAAPTLCLPHPAADPFFLYENESAVQPPTEAELAANTASLAENGTAWWGCAGGQCVASGADVAVLDNVPSAEACCRACAARYDGTPAAKQADQACNAW